MCSTCLTCPPELSASFTPGTALRYALREHQDQGRNESFLLSSTHPDMTLRGEDVSLSFRTSQRPALLLYVSSSHHKEYLALLISQDGR